ncbi:MAG: hypothetical protein DRQ46_00450 [Gammaproteobacteria bacterium]|nr:MAG: hypothetical protein DRQ46_00450 [Gammaproteobacteria bacterium]
MANTLGKLVKAWAGAGEEHLDDVSKHSGLLEVLSFRGASHGLSDKFRMKVTLPGNSNRGLNGGVIPTSGTGKLLQQDLALIDSLEEVDKTEAEGYPGGVNAYFKSETPGHIESMLQTIAYQMFYGTGNNKTIKGFAQYAIDNGKATTLGGSAGNDIFCVTLKKNVCEGLYNAQAVNAGNLVTVENVSGPAGVYKVLDTTTGEELKVLQTSFESRIGLRVGAQHSVATLTNVDATHKPTAANLLTLIRAAKAKPSTSFIFANQKTLDWIGGLKAAMMEMGPMDTNFTQFVGKFEGIPLMLDENIPEV